jgi:hypothetical protein
MKIVYDKFGWPLSKSLNDKPSILYLNKIFYLPMFLWRKTFFSFDIKNFRLISKWYCDEDLSNFTKKKLLFFKFFYLPDFILVLFSFINFFFSKIHFKLQKSDIVLFGPYSQNHTHKIVDYLLRLIFLKNNKNFRRVYVPDELKELISASKINKYLNKTRISYYRSYKNHLFYNVNYLSHIEIRTYNPFYKKIVQDYKNFFSLEKFQHNLNYKYIVISRENNKRKLLNEEDLFESLKPFGFVKINFEKLNLKEQIEISSNCKIMIGYHGAGLSNSFFMKKNQYLIDIVNSFYNHPFYNVYAKVLGLNYKKFLCSQSFKNLDGFCDVQEIRKYIRKIL